MRNLWPRVDLQAIFDNRIPQCMCSGLPGVTGNKGTRKLAAFINGKMNKVFTGIWEQSGFVGVWRNLEFV